MPALAVNAPCTVKVPDTSPLPFISKLVPSSSVPVILPTVVIPATVVPLRRTS